LWSIYEEPKEEVVQENEVLERKITYKTVVITEVTPELHVFAQNTETGKLLQVSTVDHGLVCVVLGHL
jgi:staphylococcal nuclease domain-containing protein 1